MIDRLRKKDGLVASERGSIALMAAFSLTMVILVMGMVYDFGLGSVTRMELQNVADLAAMAGGRALGAIYAGGLVDDGTQIQNPPRKPFSAQDDALAPDEVNLIQNAIANMTIQNQASGVFISIAPTDIEVGRWNLNTNDFQVGPLPANAVRVTVRRDQTSPNGPLPAFFGQLANLTGYNIIATATAALTPLQYVPPATPPADLPPGQVIFPLGIDQSILNGVGFCGTSVVVNTDVGTEPCTGWTTFNNLPTQTNFDNIVTSLVAGNPPITPQALAMDGFPEGTSFFFGGSGLNQASGLQQIAAALDPDGPLAPLTWESLLPVYQNNGGGCLPLAGQQVPIVGFVSAVIQANPFAPQVGVTFQCNVFSTGRSGDVNDSNLDYGTLGSVPVLVQ